MKFEDILNKKIAIPNIFEIMAIERKTKGKRREIAEEAFDCLGRINQAKDDPVTAWQISNAMNIAKGLARVHGDTGVGHTAPAGILRAKVKSHGKEYDLGAIGVNVVTDAGVNYIVDAFQALATIENMRWHGSGTTNTAEAAGDTTLAAETGSRVSGTLAEGASANIFRTVATIAYGSSLTIVEHGIFSASTAGTLLDRTVFAGIGVDTSTSIEFTYELTISSGG